MRRQTFSVCGLLAVLSTILIGCPGSATVPLAPAALDQHAKRFEPPPGQAVLYVIHEPIQTIAWTLFQVSVDEMPRGVVAAGTYLALVVAPGAHRVSVLTSENFAEKTVHMEAGSVIFVYLTREMGWAATRVGMRILSESAGRTAVQATALARVIPAPSRGTDGQN